MTTSRDHERGPFTVGLALDGAGWHPAAWRDDAALPTAITDAAYWVATIEAAERAGFDYVTLDDTLQLPRDAVAGPASDAEAGEVAPRPAADRLAARLDALLVASWVAPLVPRIGLVPVVTTTHTEPFHVATALQTLDHISLGRAGWQLRLSPPTTAGAFAHRAAEHPGSAAETLADAADVAEVVRGLSDSWEDDAIIRDVERARFLDRDKLHHIAFESERFSVIGPSIVPRSPQGQVVVTLLAHTPAILRLALDHADLVFVTPDADGRDLGGAFGDEGATLVELVRAAASDAERSSRGLEPLRVIADLVVALDLDDESGTARLARLDRLAGSEFDSDALVVTGGVREVAEQIGRFRELGFDGVRIRPLTVPKDADAIGRSLLPELVRLGVFAPADDDTELLRTRFGLGQAVNRFSAKQKVEA